MLDKEKKGFSVRFRKIDNDLKEAIKFIDDGVISELARNGLRLMLGIHTAKQMEVKEKQIILQPVIEQTKEKTVQLQGKPTVFIPQKQL